MKRKIYRKSIIAAGVFSVILVSVAVAVTGIGISWWSVDGGGGVSRGGTFVLVGSIGQPDAAAMRGGGYVLEGGFLAGAKPGPVRVERWWEYEGAGIGKEIGLSGEM